ncbi:hypothetical protein ACHAO7_012021, partial [Fusarium culmorum]
EQKKIEEDKRAAEEALEEAMARLARVRKMKRHLKEQGDALFVRGMQSLEEREVPIVDQAESNIVNEAQSHGAFDVINWGSVFTDIPFTDPSLFSDTAGGSSSGVAGH